MPKKKLKVPKRQNVIAEQMLKRWGGPGSTSNGRQRGWGADGREAEDNSGKQSGFERFWRHFDTPWDASVLSFPGYDTAALVMYDHRDKTYYLAFAPASTVSGADPLVWTIFSNLGLLDTRKIHGTREFVMSYVEEHVDPLVRLALLAEGEEE